MNLDDVRIHPFAVQNKTTSQTSTLRSQCPALHPFVPRCSQQRLFVRPGIDHERNIYTGSDQGRILSFDAQGSKRWEVQGGPPSVKTRESIHNTHCIHLCTKKLHKRLRSFEGLGQRSSPAGSEQRTIGLNQNVGRSWPLVQLHWSSDCPGNLQVEPELFSEVA